MNNQQPIHPNVYRISGSCGLASILIGLLVILGWVFHLEILKTLVPGAVTMKFNAALGFVLAGWYLMLLSTKPTTAPLAGLRPCLLALVALIGFLTLAEYAFGRSFGIDELFIKDSVVGNGTSNPGRMAPNSALNFVLIGFSLFWLTRSNRGVLVAQGLAMAVIFVTFLSLLGYLYQAKILVTILSLNHMAIHTMLGFLLVAIGLLAVRSEQGFLYLFREKSLSGFMGRRFVLPILIIPPLLCWLSLEGEKVGLYDSAFNASLVALLSGAGLAIVLVLALHQLSRKEAEKTALEDLRAKLLISEHAALEASRLKSEFLANMSHEIRTPMNAILGLTQLAMDLELPAQLRDYLDKINGCSKSLLSILNDILDFSQIEAGQFELENAEYSVEEVLKSIEALFKFQIEQKGLELVFDVKPNVPQKLIGDALKIGQILINLISNAVKFTQKGEIVLQLELAHIEEGNVTLRFSIQDTGIGMTPEQAARLFQPFSQADNSIRRRFGGTGLGLIISQELVKKMEGLITVESEPGQGSQFNFSIKQRLVENGLAGVGKEILKSKRVLVVDDLEASRVFLRELLSSWQYEVIEANSGSVALNCLKDAIENDQSFQLLIVDWKMPSMDGVTLLEKIKEMLQSHKVEPLPKLMMLTAYGAKELNSAAQNLHLDALLTKPVLASELMATLLRLQGEPVVQHTDRKVVVREVIPEEIRGAHILLVEDNPINQQVVGEFLEREGFAVTVAANGLKGLELVTQREFDLILMDMHMPEMDGLEATRLLRQDPRYKSVPIVAMTAAAMERDRAACLEAGMNDHLAKPVDRHLLMKALGQWIQPRTKFSRQPQDERRSERVELPFALPGFDCQGAIRRMDISEVLYRQLLSDAGEIFEQDFADLSRHLRDANYTEAFASVHRLKGGASLLGADLLSEQSAALELALQGKKFPIDLSPMTKSLKITLDSLSSLRDLSKKH